jgi:hypothetical protein
VAAMFVNGAELNAHSLWMTFQGCFLPSFDSFGQAVSEEKIYLEIIYGKSFIKIAHFVLIHQQTWLPQAILVSDWLISKKSS